MPLLRMDIDFDTPGPVFIYNPARPSLLNFNRVSTSHSTFLSLSKFLIPRTLFANVEEELDDEIIILNVPTGCALM